MADVPIAVAVPIHNPAAPAVPGTVIAPAHNPAAPAVPGTVIAPAAANEFSQEELTAGWEQLQDSDEGLTEFELDVVSGGQGRNGRC